MKPIQHPPDVIFRAYADLVYQVFLYLRSHSGELATNQEGLHDLADAMHNIGDFFTNYGAWIDDEQYRLYYLRPFDKKWGASMFGLEEFLEQRLRVHSQT